MIRLLFMILVLLPGLGAAETIVAARTIRPHEVITAADLAIKNITVSGGIQDPARLIGLEARVALYAGRPVRAGDVGAPAMVERNQIVPMVYKRGALVIHAEGRALDRASAGEWIRVMNTQSHTTVSARVAADGRVHVGQ